MLSPGTRLGPYEILSALGAGGMGEVYRARDTKLNRDVAIKVLLPAVANDPDRLARFNREAQVLASLNHANIAHIYGVEEANGVTALVMELVEGEDLSQRIARSAIPLDEALPIARQIAEALEAAHDHSIIHRDLKPANIKVRADGTVKVLDFGLAKAVDPTAGSSATAMNSPTLSIHGTQAGIILGTAPYMSPEQARGKSVDKRSDIWAFGCVLFEMLTGTRAFSGDDPTDIIVAVVSKEPDWRALPAAVPPSIRTLLRRSLEKDPRRRLDSAAAIRIEIDDAVGLSHPSNLSDLSNLLNQSNQSNPPNQKPWPHLLPWAVAAIVAAGVSVASLRQVAAPALEVTRTLVSVAPAESLRSTPADDERLGEGRPSRTAFALSPNGRFVVFSAVKGDRQQLFVRALDQLEATPLPGTEEGHSPFFSPDGQWVGFQSKDLLQKVPLTGEAPPSTICQAAPLFGATWGSRDTIVYAIERGGLWSVSAGGGTPQPLTSTEPSEYNHRLPHFLPDGQTVLFTVVNIYLPKWDEVRLALVSPTGVRRDLGVGADARYVASGHLVFMRSGALVAAPFDASKGEIAGDIVTMIGDVGHAANMANSAVDTGAGQFSVAASGSLLYLPGGMFPDRELSVVSVDRQGVSRVLPIPPRAYGATLLSPDGTRLVMWTQGLDRNIWTYDLTRGTLTRLTTEGRNHRGIWTTDGKRITYTGTGGNGSYNLFMINADGSGAPERLFTSPRNHMPSSWSPDGTLSFMEDTDLPGGLTPLAMSATGDRQPRRILQARPGVAFSYLEFSPDGRWLAYVSDESGRDEVYVQPYPGPGPRKQISNDGGRAPAWSRNGRELFYWVGATPRVGMMSVPLVVASSSLSAGAPRKLFEGPYGTQSLTRGYDVTADGQRFFLTVLKERPPVRSTQMILVQNWVEELKRRAPVK